ncbi:LytTR family DNA-binding domain-containing protein [Pseudotabrizicola alkalilacus]|uniref:LytTR family transcriptional regulator n=1 Tax=Pseudotabrizicola alkalilacus TaxID=2305252 RepID=A0A411YXM0_9RHOB|nr:LytTR family DNA-binding domain-containing protein [Pseudotabrizicola alkalilacus]RGP35552.1 LytTR family transcriptional regulator [Pseudotabrizicola alkalilacus]
MSDRSPFPTLDHLAAQIDPRSSWTGYLIAAGALLSIGLALTEPSASDGFDLPARLVFWLAHVSSALVLFELAQIYLGRIALFERLPPLALIVLVGVMGALLFAIFNLLVLDRVVFLTGGLMDPEPLSFYGLLEELRDSGTKSVLFWVLLNSPRLIIIAQQTDTDVIDQRPTPDAEQVPEDAANQSVNAGGPLLDLLSRLPRRIGTDIVAISADLHYLRVYTTAGEALILMSFGRAVEALSVIPGQRVHRSHWVALAHVLSLDSDGDRVLCRLKTGVELPVSRTYRTRLRAGLATWDEQRLLQAAQKMSAVPDAT